METQTQLTTVNALGLAPVAYNYNSIVVTNKQEAKQADALRKEMKKDRLNAVNIHKELKAPLAVQINNLDAALKAYIEPLKAGENYLDTQVTAFEAEETRKAKERVEAAEKKRKERHAQLAATGMRYDGHEWLYCDMEGTEIISIIAKTADEIGDEQFSMSIDNIREKIAYSQVVDADKIERSTRWDRISNATGWTDDEMELNAVGYDTLSADDFTAWLDAVVVGIKAEKKAETDRLAEEERLKQKQIDDDRRELQKLREEKAAKDKAEAEAKAKIERTEREKKEAEEKRIRDLEAQNLLAQEQEYEAADKELLTQLSHYLSSAPFFECQSRRGQGALESVKADIEKIARGLNLEWNI